MRRNYRSLSFLVIWFSLCLVYKGKPLAVYYEMRLSIFFALHLTFTIFVEK